MPSPEKPGSASTSPPPVTALKRPGGARPLPTRAGASAPPKLNIPEGNVPGIHVDQANEGGWQKPNPSLPSLALNPMRSSSSTPRPKLSLSTGPSPAASPALLPTDPPGGGTAAPVPVRPLDLHGAHGYASAPTLRPNLLNAPGAQAYSTSRSATPSLKLAIPGLGGAGSNFSRVGHQYPAESDPDKTYMGAPPGAGARHALEQELRTPTQGQPSGGAGSFAYGYGGSYGGGYADGGDRDVTLMARARDDDGDGESSYGYGRIGGGLNNGNGAGGDAMSCMTAEVRQALTRSRFDAGTPGFGSRSQGQRSRASSSASSAHTAGAGNSRPTSRGGPTSGGSGGGHELSLDKLSLHDMGTPRSSGEFSRNGQWSAPGHDPVSPTIDPDKLVVIKRLGEGSGGAVELVKDTRTGRIMAKKVIARTANPAMHRQLLRELEFLNSCDSPYIVEHYGSFLADHDTLIGILMEYCEGGSLDGLLGKMKTHGMRCSEHVLGRIASSVLRGLDYLHERRIIHRDIKPSNILLTKSGVCKLCDFGVSGELVDSIAGTFTGTSYYMAPERIEGKEYNINADVWSLGLTLHEVAHLRFPYPPEGENEHLTPIELVHLIVRGDVPVMKDDENVVWSQNIKDFMGFCLIRDGTLRPYPRDLLMHPFIKQSEAKNVNMAKWVAAILAL